MITLASLWAVYGRTAWQIRSIVFAAMVCCLGYGLDRWRKSADVTGGCRMLPEVPSRSPGPYTAGGRRIVNDIAPANGFSTTSPSRLLAA